MKRESNTKCIHKHKQKKELEMKGKNTTKSVAHLLNINGNMKPSNCKHKRDLTHNKTPIKT